MFGFAECRMYGFLGGGGARIVCFYRNLENLRGGDRRAAMFGFKRVGAFSDVFVLGVLLYSGFFAYLSR